MSKKDPNYTVKVEKAIAKKYGEETIQHPKSNWTDEKEKEYFIKYLPTKKKISKRQDKKDYSNNPFNVLHQLNLK